MYATLRGFREGCGNASVGGISPVTFDTSGLVKDSFFDLPPDRGEHDDLLTPLLMFSLSLPWQVLLNSLHFSIGNLNGIHDVLDEVVIATLFCTMYLLSGFCGIQRNENVSLIFHFTKVCNFSFSQLALCWDLSQNNKLRTLCIYRMEKTVKNNVGPAGLSQSGWDLNQQ